LLVAQGLLCGQTRLSPQPRNRIRTHLGGGAGCVACHSISDNDTQKKAGPHLHGIVGRPKANTVGFKYSDALKRLGGVWTAVELNAFIAGSLDYAPGTKMETSGVTDPAVRANIIAYLQAASE